MTKEHILRLFKRAEVARARMINCSEQRPIPVNDLNNTYGWVILYTKFILSIKRGEF